MSQTNKTILILWVEVSEGNVFSYNVNTAKITAKGSSAWHEPSNANLIAERSAPLVGTIQEKKSPLHERSELLPLARGDFYCILQSLASF